MPYQIICCEKRLNTICKRAMYDPPGRKLAAATPNTITEKQVDLMNSPAMHARSRKESWKPFFDKPLTELVAVPNNVDLVDANPAIYAKARLSVEGLYKEFIRCNGISDMSASKLSYLHRPKLIAISDSYVRKFLGISRTTQSRKQDPNGDGYVRCGLAVLDAVRSCGQVNNTILTQLEKYTTALSYPDGTAANYSKSRIIDLYLWTEEAITNQHSFWSKWHKEHKGKCNKSVTLNLP